MITVLEHASRRLSGIAELLVLHVNKIDIAVCFSKIICQFLLVCFIVCVSKISDKTDRA